MINDAKISKYVPLDKSWVMRMGFRDAIVQQKSYTIAKLEMHQNLQPISDDLQSLKDVLYSLKTAHLPDPVSVGESATLYRFLKYFLMVNGYEKEVIKEGTLLNREITEPAKAMTSTPYSQLLKLDGGTSQYASIRGIFNNLQKSAKHYPYHLKLTVEANKHYDKTHSKWRMRLDDTIYKQLNHYLNDREFELDRAEHFCYAYMFDLITVEEAEKLWPQLANHESNRLKEIVEQKQLLLDGATLDSLDHRVNQATILYAIKNKLDFKATDEALASIDKSWPSFRNLIEVL